MKIFQTILIFASVFFPILVIGQNLLVNGGFEEENTCSEYKVECAPEAWISNSTNFNNYFRDANRSYAGERCLAIEAGHSAKPFHRTFIRSKLLCGLRRGHQYRVEFYVKSPHQILDSVGVLFTSHDPLYDKRKIQHIIPSLFAKPLSGSFTNDSSWQKVSMAYTANGTESFIAIANFSRKDITGSTNLELMNSFFVYLDEVSIVPLDADEQLCSGASNTRQDIYDQNERHQFLQRLIREYRNDPPVVKLSPTSFATVHTILFPDVLFATGKASLEEGFYILLDSICHSLEKNDIDSIVISGHTDSTGSRAINEQLSRERANAVAMEMSKCLGLTSEKLRIIGYADDLPIASNSTPAGRRANRRVEVLIYTRE